MGAAVARHERKLMTVAQKGVEAFVAQAMVHQVPFPMETVFSHWHERPDGTVESKIDLIRQMQAAGYFVLLCFVGLSNVTLSLARVLQRVASGGHAVEEPRLLGRFPRTQRAIGAARAVADAAMLVDNSLDARQAFSVCWIQAGEDRLYDRREEGDVPAAIREWLDVVAPVAPA